MVISETRKTYRSVLSEPQLVIPGEAASETTLKRPREDAQLVPITSTKKQKWKPNQEETG